MHRQSKIRNLLLHIGRVLVISRKAGLHHSTLIWEDKSHNAAYLSFPPSSPSFNSCHSIWNRPLFRLVQQSRLCPLQTFAALCLGKGGGSSMRNRGGLDTASTVQPQLKHQCVQNLVTNLKHSPLQPDKKINCVPAKTNAV